MESRPNILFFFPDQHRFDWLGANPAVPVRTPNLDGLAARGARFANAICPSPLCAPSRACLASGKEYDRCRVADNGDDYPLDQLTFYTLLRDASGSDAKDGGYHVAGCGKFDLAKAMHDWGVDGKRLLKEWGFSDGVDNEGKWDGVNAGAGEPKGPYLAWLHRNGLAGAHVEDFQRRRSNPVATFPTPLPEEAYCDNWAARVGLDLMRGFPRDKPWFLQVNFPGPHDPWDITEEMEKSCRHLKGFPQPVESKRFAPEEHLRARQNYSAMVENIDRWVGVYVEGLRRRGELEDTLIVYSSDHGEMLGDHDLWGKNQPYHPSVAVPLIVVGPGVEPGQVIDAPTEILDLTATFLDYAGVARPGDMDSRSLRPVLEGRTDRVRECALSGLGDWRMAMDGRHKLVRREGGEPWLFDMRKDPRETHNLAAHEPEIVARLRRQMEGETAR